MTDRITHIQGAELQRFVRCAERNRGIRLFVHKLIQYNQIQSKEYTILKAEKCRIRDYTLSILVMGLNNNKVKIVFVETDRGYNIYASIIEENYGKEWMKGYRIFNNGMKQIVSIDYDDKFKQGLKELEQKEAMKEEICKEGIPCIYGNWCGPGCSGPEDPISPVDACCKAHDLCYGERGYFSNSCDDEFIDCLAPYVVQGDKWAIIMSKWFRH